MKSWARRIKQEIKVVWLAARDPRAPPMAKLLAAVAPAWCGGPGPM